MSLSYEGIRRLAAVDRRLLFTVIDVNCGRSGGRLSGKFNRPTNRIQRRSAKAKTGEAPWT